MVIDTQKCSEPADPALSSTLASALRPSHTNAYGVWIGLEILWAMFSCPLGKLDPDLLWSWLWVDTLSWADANTSSGPPGHASFCGCDSSRALLAYGILLRTKYSFPASSTTGLKALPFRKEHSSLITSSAVIFSHCHNQETCTLDSLAFPLVGCCLRPPPGWFTLGTRHTAFYMNTSLG